MTTIKSTSEIRQGFLDFFAKKGHQAVSSSSLVPDNDPTLLVTNAGMHQFKDPFSRRQTRTYTPHTSTQRSVPAGRNNNT